MFAYTPPAEEISIVFQQIVPFFIVERLHKWDPEIDPAKLKLISCQHVTWNNGSLGCPMPGKNYTQALVPGFLFLIQYDDLIIEVHTDSRMKSIALPGVGFI